MSDLYILPSAPIFLDAGGSWIDEKMYDGLSYFTSRWRGKVIILLKKTKNPIVFGKINVDNCLLNILMYDSEPDLSDAPAGSVVLASADDYSQLKLHSKYPALKNIIYVLENTFLTRCQIMFSGRRNFKRLLGGLWFLFGNELSIRRALKKSAGLQANGYCAYLKYKKYSKNALVYFDTRLNDFSVANVDDFHQKYHSPVLRLAYSGRLTAIKGSNYLIPLALALKKRDVKYILSIYGDGDLHESMKKNIEQERLSENVILCGAVDFKSELILKIREETDLFVMPHIQGDPSCTYFETLALGVPIIGFANETFNKILTEFGDMGWAVGVGDVDKMAELIRELSIDRKKLLKKSLNVVRLARGVNFESQLEKRITQLSNLALEYCD